MNSPSRPSFSRLISSKAIDDLLNLSDRRHPPNWLLTYIDVFVLIVMLVVTLISLSRFEPVENQAAGVQAAAAPIQPVVITEPPVPISKTPTATPTPPSPPSNSALSKPLTPTLSEPPPPETKSEKSVVGEPPAHVEAQKEQRQASAAARAETEKVEAEAESELKQRLLGRLEQLGLGDSIALHVSQGHAELEIQDDILYRSSDAELTESGRLLLTRLTPLLQQARGLIFIEGHTDDRPIHTARFPSNWELGAARATSVLHFLASQHIDANRMRAVSFADTRPVADNDDKEGRQKNRRVNIVIRVAEEVKTSETAD